jgi:hypothetical protein
MLQRLLFLGIALVFLLNIVGNYPAFQLKQWAIHQKIAVLLKKPFHKKDLQTVIIASKNSQELRWERDGQEFWYNNNLYDVAFFEKNDTSTTYYCLQDTEETELTQNFYASIVNNEAKKLPFGNFLKKNVLLYFPTYIYVLSETTAWSKVEPEKNEAFPKRAAQYISKFFNRIDLPPEA